MITELEAQQRAAQRQLEQLTAPQRAIAVAKAELTALEQQIEAARQQEARAATIAQLVEQASAGAQALADVQQAQEAFDQAIAPLLAAYTAARERQAQARSAFYATLAELTPEARRKMADQTAPRAILAELETTGADLAGVLAGLDGRDLPLDRPYPATHQYPGALHQALRESFVHHGGHLPRPDAAPQIEQRTGAQLLGGK
jgi:hypothetical protein